MRTSTTGYDDRYSTVRTTRNRFAYEQIKFELAQFLVELVEMPEMRPILEETKMRIVGYDDCIEFHRPQEKTITANETFWAKIKEIKGIGKILKRLKLEIHITDTPAWEYDQAVIKCKCYDCNREEGEEKHG